MIRLLADQDFNERIIRGLIDREPTLDLIRVREIGLAAVPDDEILDRAAAESRVVITHDRQTLAAFAYARVAAGDPMPGVFLVDKKLGVGQAIDELRLAIHCLSPDECRNLVRYFPL